MARLQYLRDYEFAITPMNIKHQDFDDLISKRLVLVTCQSCGTKFYVGTLDQLEIT